MWSLEEHSKTLKVDTGKTCTDNDRENINDRLKRLVKECSNAFQHVLYKSSMQNSPLLKVYCNMSGIKDSVFGNMMSLKRDQ